MKWCGIGRRENLHYPANAEIHGISKSTWDHRRDELLENFCLYYEYEVVYEGRSTKYHIIRKLGDYQKPLSKRSKELRDQIYEKEIWA